MTNDVTQIRALLADLTQAIHDKDAAAAIAPLADDAVVYDLAPPLRMGPGSVREPALYEEWFGTWESRISSEARDLEIAVGGDIAYAYGLQHMTGTKIGGVEVDLWFRATACFRKEAGRWRITHMHNSVPFAMDGSDRALLDLKP
jgi:ketosteroid isomerase-like protein